MSKVVNIKTLKKQVQKKKRRDLAKIKEEQMDELAEMLLDAILFYCSDKPHIEPDDVMDVLLDVQNAIALVNFMDEDGLPDGPDGPDRI